MGIRRKVGSSVAWMATTLFACAVSLGIGADMSAPQTNLVQNPGFEVGQGIPAGWSFSWKGTRSKDPNAGVKREPDWGWDAGIHRAGGRSVRIGVARAEDDGAWIQDGIPHLVGTHMYCLSAWFRTEGMDGTVASMGVICLDAEGKFLKGDYNVIRATGNHGWRQYAGLVDVPPGTKRFRLRLWLNPQYSGKGTVWCDDVVLCPTSFTGPPPIRYVDDAPTPQLTDADKHAGYAIFSKHALAMVFPTTVPRAEELTDRLSMFASPGEYESKVFCVRALKDLGTVKVRGGELQSGGVTIPAGAVRVNPVKCLVRRGQSRWGPYMDGDMLVPVIVEETDATVIREGTTAAFMVTACVPKDAAPGDYKGVIEVAPEAGERREILLSLEVMPIRLLEPEGLAFGMYTRFRREPADFVDGAYADMRAHGMNTVGLCADLGTEIRLEGGVAVARLDGSSDLELALEAYRRAGFTRPLIWLMGSDVVAFCLKQGPLESDRFAACYREVIEAVLRAGKARGWPEIIFQPIDEPYEHAEKRIGGKDGPRCLEVARRCLQILKSIPGVRTEADGANGRPENAAALHQWVDLEVYHDGPVMRRGTYDAGAWKDFLRELARDGKAVWFYNTDITGFHPEACRFGYGFGLFQSGATGALNWSYMGAFKPADPEWLYRNPMPMVHRYNRTLSEPGGATTAWEAIREGVDDCRYLATLFALIGRMKDSEKAALAAEAEADIRGRLAKIDFNGATGTACQGDWSGQKGILPTGEKFVSGEYKMANGLAFAEYDAIRRAAANWIVRLQETAR